MEDLLQEEEFIKTKEFRLRRHVLLYCVAAISQLTLLFISIRGVDQDTTVRVLYYSMRIWVVMNVFFPLIFPLMMVFNKEKMTSLSLRTIFYSLLCLSLAYMIGFFGISNVDATLDGRDTNSDDFLIPVYLGGFLLFLYSVIILPIVRYRQKNKF